MTTRTTMAGHIRICIQTRIHRLVSNNNCFKMIVFLLAMATALNIFLAETNPVTITRTQFPVASMHNHTSTSTSVCGRSLPKPIDIDTLTSEQSEQHEHMTSNATHTHTNNNDEQHFADSHRTDVAAAVVVIGHHRWLTRDKTYGQTNNQILTLMHAFDASVELEAALVIQKNSWGHKLLKLFLDNSEMAAFQQLFNVQILNRRQIQRVRHSHSHSHSQTQMVRVFPMSAKDLFYRELPSNVSISEIIQRRKSVFRFLWSNVKPTFCSAIERIDPPSKFTVIHSRWMQVSDPACPKRLATIADREYLKKNVRLDRSAPCELYPSYVHSILKANGNGMLDAPIYIITDGFNPEIVHRIENDPVIGKNVKTVPITDSWVGGDMMLGVLADVFIGTPTSTFSENIARARISFGFDAKTNYLRPLERNETERDQDGAWEFHCQTTECMMP